MTAPTLVARPTVYDGIQMRSRLEARFAAFLDRAGFEWEYEPRAFASRDGQYLPDFVVRGAGAAGDLYIEVKGERPRAPYWPIVERMEVVLQSDAKASLAMFAEGFLTTGRRRGLHDFADVRPVAGQGWASGGVGLCGCGRVRFFCAVYDTDPDVVYPRAFCSCSDPIIRAYINPFGAAR